MKFHTQRSDLWWRDTPTVGKTYRPRPTCDKMYICHEFI